MVCVHFPTGRYIFFATVSGGDGGVGWKTEGRVMVKVGGGSGDCSDNVQVCHSRLSSAAERSPGEKRAMLGLTVNTHPDKWQGTGRTYFWD